MFAVVLLVGEPLMAQEDPLESLIEELTRANREPPLPSVQTEKQLLAAIAL